ncbi:hypothetical protein CRENBAI_008839 [Crenichthys baileyi]|uniref:Epidermal growth factor receptor substrate 15 n=1 Tax=Crenichthys baileyi TaxID=28760 RepID=A0AAV9SMY0_9TELE
MVETRLTHTAEAIESIAWWGRVNWIEWCTLPEYTDLQFHTHTGRGSSASSAVKRHPGRAAMEEPAVQHEKIDKSQEQGEDGGKADWKNECSFSDLLKHSCFLCWSSPGDSDVIEMDDGVLAKAGEIRELENALAVENVELQEQQSDSKDLQETLVKLEEHKEKLIQQIKETRQLCYEESQKILSLQAEEAQKESQVEEYERELARARWRLKKLREEVKKAKMKVEEAQERNTPLQDSIRQSYEEILQEEHTLYSLSGGVVTPDSQLEESTSPADTTEDDPLPMKPWGRSQSLPAYADLIMGAGDLSFCNNLAGTREDDESGSSSTKEIDRSDIEEDPENGKIHNEMDNEREEASTLNPAPLSQLDFYQVNLFTYCQTDNDLFNEDLFPKTDSSDGFASDPFKGNDPFAKDIFYSSTNEEVENVCDEADTSLSCAENKASTGTQCFESEFPDEDSDIEISYSREDLDAIAIVDDFSGFKPIQSSSEELMPEPIVDRKCPGQHSLESDPSGYELDLCLVSSPSKTEEHHHGSLAKEDTSEETGGSQVPSCVSAQAIHHHHSDHLMLEPHWISDIQQTVPHDLPSRKDSSISESANSQMFFGADLGSVFGAGGYIGCPDVADDLEPLNRCQENPPPKPAPDPIQPVRPIRPPRPSLKKKEEGISQGIDLK